VARLSATHERAQTVSGPPQSPTRSLEVSGSQTDPLTPCYNGRAGIIPFRYSPGLHGVKGTSHVGWDTSDLTSQGEKLQGSNPPGPCVPHSGAPTARQCPLPSRGDALFSEQGPGIVVVVSCTKCPSQESICASLNVAVDHSRRGASG